MKRSKYWGMAKNNDAKLLASLRNSQEPFHKVTHREPGDIPGCTMLPPNERYTGVFPSPEACSFVNEMKNNMKFFDDGQRLVYNSKPRQVPLNPCDVIHPITYPPEGFVLSTDANGDRQWVYQGEKL